MKDSKSFQSDLNLFLFQGVLTKPLSKKNWKLTVENLDLYGIFVMMRWSLVTILVMKKSKFDPKRKDAAIKLYLSRLEEEISSLHYKVGYSNLTKGERDGVYSLKTTTL